MSKDKIHFVGFDGEFTDRQQMLELSMYAFDHCLAGSSTPSEGHREVFHQYFKPRDEYRWPSSERVHHISPRMVAHRPYFSRFRPMIEDIIAAADCLVGFAISNDIDALRREGVKGLDDKPYIDIRDLHWLCHGREAGVELDARRGLSVTAGELGIDFSDTDAHGASYDTLKTMECLEVLIDSFKEKYPLKEEGQDLLAHYLQIWDTEREAYYEEYAKGWIALTEANGGYRLKASRLSEPKGDKVVATVRVMARNRALDEMDARFDRKRHPQNPHVYRLGEADIKWFRSYANVYDGQEPLHRKMQELRSHGLG